MRRIWLLLAFASALVLWLWRSPRGEAPAIAAANGGATAAPGYVATNAQLIDTDADGQPQYTLHATQLQGTRVELNGKVLEIGRDDALPVLTGALTPAGDVSFEPATITFLALSNAASDACR